MKHTATDLVNAAFVQMGKQIAQLSRMDWALAQQARDLDALADRCAEEARELAERLTSYAGRIDAGGGLEHRESPTAAQGAA